MNVAHDLDGRLHLDERGLLRADYLRLGDEILQLLARHADLRARLLCKQQGTGNGELRPAGARVAARAALNAHAAFERRSHALSRAASSFAISASTFNGI